MTLTHSTQKYSKNNGSYEDLSIPDDAVKRGLQNFFAIVEVNLLLCGRCSDTPEEKEGKCTY